MYSSPPPDLKGNSDIDVTKKQLWAKQSHGILTDGSLGDINTKTVGTYGKKPLEDFNHQYKWSWYFSMNYESTIQFLL